MRKVVTISGGAAKAIGNFDVPFGMSFNDLVEVAGGIKNEPHKIIVGGPLMCFAQADIDVPIIKITQAILLLNEKESVKQRIQNCIRCGKCVDHCPIGLIPLDLSRWAQNKRSEAFIKFNGLDCIVCSCCSYVCPSHRDISNSIEVYRNALRQAK
jgi:electron transport complex protein RnfC